MKTKVLVLGCGLVGGPIARDLSYDANTQVTVADKNKNALEQLDAEKITGIQADLTDEKELNILVDDFDIIVNAVPGFMGFQTLKCCVESGKKVVDIAFYPEDPMELDPLAKSSGSVAIVDMGVAPGMSNLLTGYAASRLETVENVEIYVGGIPAVRTKPWEYKAVFSPVDVLEEYTRKARLVENGEMVVKDPLTEVEHIDFEKVGTLEAFNSDGLRSLLFTIKAKNMKEKTLRYPGYAEKISLLKSSGFFNTGKVDIGGNKIRPIDLTASLLFDQWKLKEGEVDLTIMRIVVEGLSKGQKKTYRFDLYDEFDSETGIHSMARTTGYSASMAVRLIRDGFYLTPGITVPEILGRNKDNVLFMLAGLKSRNVNYTEQVLTSDI